MALYSFHSLCCFLVPFLPIIAMTISGASVSRQSVSWRQMSRSCLNSQYTSLLHGMRHFGNWMYRVVTNCSLGCHALFFTGMQISCINAGTVWWTHLHIVTSVLKMACWCIGSQWRLCKIVKMWSHCLAADTKEAAVFCTSCSHFICLSISPVSSNPVGSMWKLEQVSLKNHLSETACSRCIW